MMVTQTNKNVCVIPLIHPALPCECPLGLSMGSVCLTTSMARREMNVTLQAERTRGFN